MGSIGRRREPGDVNLNILILGGSNSGPKTGWAAVLREIAPECRIENAFLGAVGSLFGLLRLLKMRQDGARKPDVVVFEYTLNDSLWLLGGNITLDLIENALQDVITLCAREGIGLLFLCLCLRPPEPEGEAELSLIMDQIYRKIALSRGAADCLLLTDILGGIAQRHYVDSAHIGPQPSRRVAEAVRERLKSPVPVPRGGRRSLSFSYFDATRAQTEGAVARTDLKSTVFSGPFLEIGRGGGARWRVPGRLVALMLRSTDASGEYRITAGTAAIRKNAQSLARENVPNLMTLHYVTHELPEARDIVIDMPASQDELAALPYDLTLMDGPSPTPFREQTLEINGIVVRRKRPILRRALDSLLSRW